MNFPDLDSVPTGARKLSGRLTPALAAWLREETGDRCLNDDVGALNPGSRRWSGEFSVVPSGAACDLFDIGVHPWGAEAGELKTRLARTMMDATLHPVSSRGWPRCRARTSRCSPWRDISGDAVGDSGSDIISWREAADWIRPV
ncbi:hypothetical protein [Sphingobium sp. CFD-2]|uniref:hypothetical protein n=1 Tax=Sphingobium sp. CFD-2 TaxID=2878542 RepID=UPI00214B762D|nr:hypothetical protein [Sphingobium sp. CFD-2]